MIPLPFTSASDAKGIILLPVSFPPSSFRKSSPSLLILLLHICKELRNFCGFSKVPDALHFKLGFADHIALMFQLMVDFTEPICQAIDSSLASMLTFDISSIELYVSENNP